MSGAPIPSAATRVTAALVVFLASLVTLDRAASAGLSRLGRWAEGRSEARRTLEALPDKAAYQVLVLGTSRTFEALHPVHIEQGLGLRAFKEASKGKGLRYGYEFYRLYREVVGRPKMVVYGVDYFMFGMPSDEALLDRLEARAEDAREAGARFSPLLTVAEKPGHDRAILAAVERAQQALSSAAGTFDPEHDPSDMATYTGRDASRVVPRSEPPRYERVPFTRYPGIEGEFLRRLLAECEADSVPVVLVYPPDYMATARTTFEHPGFAAELRGLIAGFPHAVFFDYHDPARFRVADPSLFLDGDYGNPNSHLSRKGSEEFASLYLPDLARVLASGRISQRPR